MAPPYNDDFANAGVLSTSLPASLASQTTKEATNESGEFDASGSGGDQSVWYYFTPTTSGIHRFVLDITGSPGAGGIAFYTGSAVNALTFYDINQYYWFYEDPSGTATTDLYLQSGITYRIRVFAREFGTPEEYTFDFDLDWSYVAALSPPANDEWANRIALSTSLPGSRANDVTIDATGAGSGIEPQKNLTQSVWYSFTPAATGNYEFTFTNITAEGISSVARLDVALYEGASFGALTPVGFYKSVSFDGAHSPHPIVRFPDLQMGTEYSIQVRSNVYPYQLNMNVAEFDMAWDEYTLGTPPANDDIADAQDLGADPDTTVAGTTINATEETFEDGFENPSVWYKFNSTVNRDMEFSAPKDTGGDAQWEPYIEIYEVLSDPPADFDDLDFLDNWNFQDNDPVIVPVETGKKYYIYVGGYYYDWSWGNFDLIIGEPPPPPPLNDTFVNITGFQYSGPASEFTLDKSLDGNYGIVTHAGKREGTTESATSEAGEGAHGGYGPTRSVWYSYYANSYNGSYEPTIRFWVESDEDCVLTAYEYNWPDTIDTLTVLDQDDDSGAGNWPQVEFTREAYKRYIIAVDSKTPGPFTLKWQCLSSGSPPANDNFADAIEITKADATILTGTTVGATGEPGELEHFSENLGPTDTVWYKYVPPHDGNLRIRGTCDTENVDGYLIWDVFRGTTLENLVRVNGQYGYPSSEYWYFGDEMVSNWNEDRIKVLATDDPYWIRVQSPEGGSEDFTIWIDQDAVYLKLTPSGDEDFHEANPEDSAEVPLRFTITSLDAGPTDEAATVYLDLQPITTYEAQGKEYTDSATVKLNFTVLGGECFSRFHFTGEGEADARWAAARNLTRWESEADQRWLTMIEVQPGC